MATGSFPIHDGSGGEPDDELNEHVHEPGDPDGLVATEGQGWQELHPQPPLTPRAQYTRRRRWSVVLIALVVLVAAAFGAYWLGNHEAARRQYAGKAPSMNSGAQTGAGYPSTNETKQYDSANFGLSFDYPADWTVNDSTKLSVTSPALQLKSAVGSNTSVRVVVTIQNQQADIPGFPAGGAVAALASDKLTYKQPSAVQRAQTYLSFLSYSQADGLDALYITGDNGYQQRQQMPMSDIVEGNPLISVRFEKCSGSCNGTADFVTLQASSWHPTAVSKQVTKLLESLVLNS